MNNPGIQLAIIIFAIVTGMILLMTWSVVQSRIEKNGFISPAMKALMVERWPLLVYVPCVVAFLIWSFDHTKGELQQYQITGWIVVVTAISFEMFIGTQSFLKSKFQLRAKTVIIMLSITKWVAVALLSVAQLRQNMISVKISLPNPELWNIFDQGILKGVSILTTSIFFPLAVVTGIMVVQYVIGNAINRHQKGRDQVMQMQTANLTVPAAGASDDASGDWEAFREVGISASISKKEMKIRKVAKQIKLNPGWSDQMIADELNMKRATVNRYRAEITRRNL